MRAFWRILSMLFWGRAIASSNSRRIARRAAYRTVRRLFR